MTLYVHTHHRSHAILVGMDLHLQVKHDFSAHQRVRLWLGPTPATIFPCYLCGKGSGVVYATGTELALHLREHTMKPSADINLPPGAKVCEPCQPMSDTPGCIPSDWPMKTATRTGQLFPQPIQNKNLGLLFEKYKHEQHPT